jgi:hypothetical protein
VRERGRAEHAFEETLAFRYERRRFGNPQIHSDELAARITLFEQTVGVDLQEIASPRRSQRLLDLSSSGHALTSSTNRTTKAAIASPGPCLPDLDQQIVGIAHHHELALVMLFDHHVVREHVGARSGEIIDLESEGRHRVYRAGVGSFALKQMLSVNSPSST